MRKSLTLIATLCALGLGGGDALAVTKTVTWTWPTTRTDGSALALSAIGGMTLYDVTVMVPGQPGNPVPCPTTIPPTTAMGTCQANVTSGHSFVITTQDTAVPPDVSAVSNSVSVPFAAPAAVTDLKIQ